MRFKIYGYIKHKDINVSTFEIVMFECLDVEDCIKKFKLLYNDTSCVITCITNY